jgi:hypothetical protein
VETLPIDPDVNFVFVHNFSLSAVVMKIKDRERNSQRRVTGGAAKESRSRKNPTNFP